MSHRLNPSYIPPNVPRVTAQRIVQNFREQETVTNPPPSNSGQTKLFVTVFASTTLFFGGVGLLAAMFFPALLAVVPHAAYRPALPIAEARDTDFLTIDDIPLKNPYPPLTHVEGVSNGDGIHIPAIDVNVPLVMSPSITDKDVLATLNKGAALYPNGVLPGHLGNTFISAHSTGEPWRGPYRFAFLRINELAPGNLMHIDYEGVRYTFRLTRKDIVTPSTDFRVISSRPVPTVTLMACWPLWTTQKRMLLTGELTNITQLTAPTNQVAAL